MRNDIGKYIAIYVRESTKKQADEGYNIELQEKECIKYLELYAPNEPYKIYREAGVSAKTTNRKQLTQLKKDVKENKVSKVIVYKMDRLVRRIYGLGEMLDLFETNNVSFCSMKEDFDTSTIMGKLMMQFIVMLAEWEQDIISQRTKEALRHGAEIGSYVLGNIVPFGLARQVIIRPNSSNITSLVEIQEEMDIVRIIYDLANNGLNINQIAIKINQLDYMLANTINFSNAQINTILSNKIYYGIMVIKDKEYRVEVPVIFEKEYWEQVQINRAIHLKRDEKNTYDFKQKVFCECGTRCIVDVTNKKKKDGSTVRYYYYVCPCCNKRINQTHLKEEVEPQLQKHYNIGIEDSIKEKINIRLMKLETLKEDMYQMYLCGEIKKEVYIKEVIKFDNDITNLKIRLKENIKTYDKLKKIDRRLYLDMTIKKINVNMKNKSIKILYTS